MAVTAIPLTTGSDTTNATSYTTASITPTPGRLVLVAVYVTVASGTTTVDLSGCGLTWVKVDQTGATARTMHLFRAMGPSTTTGRLTFTGGSQMTSALWQVVEFNGTDTTGTDGSGSIVQSVNARPGTVSSVDVPFPTTVVAANSVYAAVGMAAQETIAVGGAPWTSLGTVTQTSPTSGFLGEFAAVALQNITASWSSPVSAHVVGTEIRAAATVGTPSGAASGTVTFTGTAVGTSQPVGTATGTLAFTGTALGSSAPTGAAVGTLAFAGSAAGVSDRSGTALGLLAFTGTAVGSRANAGVATAGTLAFVGSAVGVAPVVVGISHTYGYATLTSSSVGDAALIAAPLGLATLTATGTGGFGSEFGLSFGVVTVGGAANGVGGAVLTDTTGRAVLQT